MSDGMRMANNRMYLRCEGCGEAFGMAKHFGDAWAVYGELPGLLEAWMGEHRWCPYEPIDGAHFSIAYENDPSGKAELPTDA